MSCYNTGDNKHLQCPPRMSDGRHFTDYRTNCHVNNLVRTNNAVTNSHGYRTFLTSNATKLMDINRSYASQKNGCGDCNDGHNTTMLPEQAVQICDNRSCNVDFVNRNGLGLGRKYNTIEQNCDHPVDAQLLKPSSCCAETNTQYNYYKHADTPSQGGTDDLSKNINVASQTNVPEAFNL